MLVKAPWNRQASGAINSLVSKGHTALLNLMSGQFPRAAFLERWFLSGGYNNRGLKFPTHDQSIS